MTQKPLNQGLSNKRNHRPNPPSIPYVIVPKKLDQPSLLDRHPATEKLPQDVSISHETKHVPQDQLRAQPPEEEAKVTRMPPQPVHARGDERMRIRLPRLHRVVEALARGQHGHAPHHLPSHDHHQAREHQGRAQPRRGPVPARKHGVGQHAFHTGYRVGDGVRGPICREQEGVDRGLGGVGRGGGPELEEVERGQGAEEEGDAPERRGRQGQDECRGQQAEGRGEAEGEGAQGHAGEGRGLAWGEVLDERLAACLHAR
ncbi:uncharacterized protein MAM_02525 [Metarhizium album ARSEF 1941]|uniref:Uncharacterized protein n=1 Tax=Metarhizium album (strain ARSEF 1941) TaxID=1081103 RepID=A0A0B2X1U3_METAS|nr:uncharacterized protein MAM_02525 [Metarhizium album ARSEF 1941]KHN99672.1 hypothetical protein MAM_02525 [Metarhizium album ARSEF 1941]